MAPMGDQGGSISYTRTLRQKKHALGRLADKTHSCGAAMGAAAPPGSFFCPRPWPWPWAWAWPCAGGWARRRCNVWVKRVCRRWWCRYICVYG